MYKVLTCYAEIEGYTCSLVAANKRQKVPCQQFNDALVPIINQLPCK